MRAIRRRVIQISPGAQLQREADDASHWHHVHALTTCHGLHTHRQEARGAGVAPLRHQFKKGNVFFVCLYVGTAAIGELERAHVKLIHWRMVKHKAGCKDIAARRRMSSSQLGGCQVEQELETLHRL